MDNLTAVPIPFYEYTSGSWSPASSKSAMQENVEFLRLVNYNIWFDELEQPARFNAVLAEIFALPDVDIVAIQESTPEFIAIARANPTMQRDWLLTDFHDAAHLSHLYSNFYGNSYLVRKRWAGRIQGWVREFPKSSLERYIVILDILQQNSTIIRIGNVHFDSLSTDVPNRKLQSAFSRELLVSDKLGQLDSAALLILCGDFNFTTTAELENITSHEYTDALTITGMDTEVLAKESATIGVTVPSNIYPPRRSDFVFYKADQWKAVRHEYFGNTPIKNAKGELMKSKEGRDGLLFPSDHLGVYTEFHRS